jgi:hypothetical protein
VTLTGRFLVLNLLTAVVTQGACPPAAAGPSRALPPGVLVVAPYCPTATYWKAASTAGRRVEGELEDFLPAATSHRRVLMVGWKEKDRNAPPPTSLLSLAQVFIFNILTFI